MCGRSRLDQLRFDGRVAIVTGAGRGMGASFARTLALRGAAVVVNDLGSSVDGVGADAGPAQLVAAEIRAAGGAAVASSDSVATTGGATAIVGAALDHFGRVDIVVNNAGILTRLGFPEADLHNFNHNFSVHLAGASNVTRAAWPHMFAEAYGRVVMITSSGLLGSLVNVSYASAKAGQIGLTKTLALAGASQNIKVNAVAPAADTRMTSKATLEQRGAGVALDPDLVAPAVALLSHEQCPASGEIFGVGGGRVNRLFIGVTDGYANHDLTPEDLFDNWPHVIDETSYFVPANSPDHVARLRLNLGLADRVWRRSSAEG